jgi:hypothetical protein
LHDAYTLKRGGGGDFQPCVKRRRELIFFFDGQQHHDRLLRWQIPDKRPQRALQVKQRGYECNDTRANNRFASGSAMHAWRGDQRHPSCEVRLKSRHTEKTERAT